MLNTRFFYLNSRDELLRLDMSCVVYVEAEGNYSKIHMVCGETCLVCLSLARMEELIDANCSTEKVRFARIGKRFIINIGYIFRINVLKQELVLSDQKTFASTVSISKEALKKLKDVLTKK